MRFTHVFGLSHAPAAALAVVGCWSNQGDIGLGVFGLEFLFNISTQGFVFLFTHGIPPLVFIEWLSVPRSRLAALTDRRDWLHGSLT